MKPLKFAAVLAAVAAGAYYIGVARKAEPPAMAAKPAAGNGTAETRPGSAKAGEDRRDAGFTNIDTAEVLYKIAKYTAQAEIEAALKALAAWPDSARKKEAMLALYKQWGRIAPAAALAAVDGLSLPDKIQYQNQILAGWTAVRPGDAWDWAMKNPIDRSVVASVADARLGMVVKALLANDDPETAIKFVNTLPNGAGKSAMAIDLATYLIETDPKRAMQWLSQDLSVSARTNAIAATARNLAAKSPQTAAEFGLAIGERNDRNIALRTAFDAWGRSGDKDAALAWFAAHRDLPDINTALSAYVPRVVLKDPAMASGLLASFSDARARDRAIEDTLRVLSAFEPKPAVDWLLDTAQNEQRLARLSPLVAAWGKKDGDGVATFLKSDRRLSPQEAANLQQLVFPTK